MAGDPILVLTAGAQLRAVLDTQRAELRALFEHHVAQARALGLPDAASRPAYEAKLAELDEIEAQSRAMDEQVYQRCPHLRPENVPDE